MPPPELGDHAAEEENHLRRGFRGVLGRAVKPVSLAVLVFFVLEGKFGPHEHVLSGVQRRWRRLKARLLQRPPPVEPPREVLQHHKRNSVTVGYDAVVQQASRQAEERAAAQRPSHSNGNGKPESS